MTAPFPAHCDDCDTVREFYPLTNPRPPLEIQAECAECLTVQTFDTVDPDHKE